MIDQFKAYNQIGLKTLPIQKSKMPVQGLVTWKGGVTDESFYKDAYGIAMICGEASGGLECIDFDNHFGDAKETISEFIKTPEIEELYHKHNFPIESTPSGGYHLIYQCSRVTGNQKLARKPQWDEKTRKWKPDAIIETRGEGGYFVVDPTPGYKVVRNVIEFIPEISPEEREIILSVCKSFNTWTDREIKQPFEEKERPGDIYNNKHESIDDAVRCLKSAGWAESRPGMWRRPDKKDGISATFGKVAPNVFYVFSSSAYPFDPDTGYKPFQIVALLKYNGDFSAFAKELSGKYTDIVQDTKPEKVDKEQPKESDLDDILKKSFIDLDIPVSKPPIAVYIVEQNIPGYYDKQRLFTLSNFSAITGKGKSKKTFLTSLILAAASGGCEIENKFVGNLPPNKRNVILFDTEQSVYDAWMTSKRIPELLGSEAFYFSSFNLREFEPLRRCEIIEHALMKFGNSLGLVVIDGIADLAKAINDEEESTRVGTLLMRWTKQYNIHIVTVIHQNKGDNYATGHLGSMIIKKAEAVIGVERDVTDKTRSVVTCDNMRGVADFDDFSFIIENHLPKIDEFYKPNKGKINV